MNWHPVPSRRRSRPTFCRPRVEELEARRLMSVNVLTYHNNNARTGANLQETTLTPDNVNANDFGLLTSYPLDGQTFTQPLYISNLTLPDGSTHNVVFIATEHDSVYAFDADGGGLLWQDSFIDPANGITTVPSSENFGDVLGPEEGITGTPVIDPQTGALYVVAMTKEVSDGITSYVQRLHALDVTTGAELFGGPVVIAASVPGTGDGSQDGQVSFDPFRELQRPGLLLSHGVVYVSWASFEDTDPYHGWVLGYDAQTLALVDVFNDTPNGSEGGIWMSGAALAADRAGSIYVNVGNGSFDPSAGNFGEDVISLATQEQGLSVSDYFAPYNWQSLDAIDADLGSGGVMLIPNQNDGSPPLLVTMGKEGVLYLLDRTNLGGFNADGDVVHQEIRNLAPLGSYDTPAYFDGQIYYVFAYDEPQAFALSGGYLSPTPVSQGTAFYGYGGATVSISANGNTNGIVWAIQGTEADGRNAVLHAYDATDLSHELYNSTQNVDSGQLGKGIRFQLPTVADGKVFLPTVNGLFVFGLFAEAAVPSWQRALAQVLTTPTGNTVPGVSPNIIGTPGAGQPDLLAGESTALAADTGMADSSLTPAEPSMPSVSEAAGVSGLATGLEDPADAGQVQVSSPNNF